MSEVILLVRVPIFSGEIGDSLESHASAPKWKILPILVHLDDFVPYLAGSGEVVSITAWPKDSVELGKSIIQFLIRGTRYQGHDSGSGTLQEFHKAGHHIVSVVGESWISLHLRL
jgi:hypothetical protein